MRPTNMNHYRYVVLDEIYNSLQAAHDDIESETDENRLSSERKLKIKENLIKAMEFIKTARYTLIYQKTT